MIKIDLERITRRERIAWKVLVVIALCWGILLGRSLEGYWYLDSTTLIFGTLAIGVLGVVISLVADPPQIKNRHNTTASCETCLEHGYEVSYEDHQTNPQRESE